MHFLRGWRIVNGPKLNTEIHPMPRLTDEMYLAHRQRLSDAWEFRPGLFAELQTFEQRDLHRYFAPSRELYDDDVLAYRREVTKLVPSLPSQAGRAYAHFERVIAEDKAKRANPPVKAVRTKDSLRLQRVVTVKATARPEIDVHRLARLLVSLALEGQANDSEPSGSLRN